MTLSCCYFLFFCCCEVIMNQAVVLLGGWLRPLHMRFIPLLTALDTPSARFGLTPGT